MALWPANVLRVLSVKPLYCVTVKFDFNQCKTVDYDCKNLHDTHRLILIDGIQSSLFVRLFLAFTLFFPPKKARELKNAENHPGTFKDASLVFQSPAKPFCIPFVLISPDIRVANISPVLESFLFDSFVTHQRERIWIYVAFHWVRNDKEHWERNRATGSSW